MEELFKLAGTQGIWCVLSIFLLCWVIRNNKERETRYMEHIAIEKKINYEQF